MKTGGAVAFVLVGRVAKYYQGLGVASVEVAGGGFALGDALRVVGHTTDLALTVESLEKDHRPVNAAGFGERVGLKVPGRARTGDEIYKVIGD